MEKNLLSSLVLVCSLLTGFAADKKIVLVAGKPSHGPAQHEHNAGSLLLKKCLDAIPGIRTDIHLNGWPEDEKFFDGADAIVLYMDGGAGHELLQGDRLKKMGERINKGVGLACIHYATEPTPEKGQKEFLEWIGGAFEPNRSVNPHWDADFKKLPKHPITNGVKPFKINDEWYFHLRFLIPDSVAQKVADVSSSSHESGKPIYTFSITPILCAVPPESTMSRPDGPHEGNSEARGAVKRQEPQTVAWARENGLSGRGFGFTGGHFHKNWGDENFRKIVLNAIVWIAKADVPKNGVDCKITAEDLKQNLDPKGKAK